MHVIAWPRGNRGNQDYRSVFIVPMQVIALIDDANGPSHSRLPDRHQRSEQCLSVLPHLRVGSLLDNVLTHRFAR